MNFSFKTVCYFILVFLLCLYAASAASIVQSAYSLIQDEGVSLTRASTLNFTGSAITCSTASTVTTCNITGGGGGGGGTSVVAYGSLPAASTAGLAYLFSDSLYQAVDNGSAYNFFYQGVPVTPPSSSGWTALNPIGGVVVSSSGGFRNITSTAVGDGQIHGEYRALPTAPYDIKIAFQSIGWAGLSLSGCGWYDTVSGKFIFIYPSFSGGQGVTIQTWNSVSSVGANYPGWGPRSGIFPTQPFWLRLVDDTTNRQIWLSPDGLSWFLIFETTRTDFLTPDSFFHATASFSAALPAIGETLVSYQP